MTSTWKKFKLLVWKNWLIQRRHPVQTAVEIIAPVLFCILLIVIRSLVNPTVYEDNTTYDFFTPKHKILRFRVVWSPENPELEKIIDVMSKRMLPFRAEAFSNSSELEKHLMSPGKQSKYTLAGLEFDDSLQNITKLPPKLKVSIRFPAESRYDPLPIRQDFAASNWRTNFLFPLYQVPGPRERNYTDGGYPPGYNSEGFLNLQQELLNGILQAYNNSQKVEKPSILMNRFPYPKYIEDPILPALTVFLPMVMMLSFLYTCISTVKIITSEKEKQLKEAMKIMGLSNSLHWCAWFFKILSFVFISIILITFLLKIPWYTKSNSAFFAYSSPTLILWILFQYMCTTITFCFMISVFFSKANTASLVAGVIWFVAFAPYSYLQQKYQNISFTTKISACLGHNSAMGFAFQFVMMYEGIGEGIQWNNIFTSINPLDDFVLGHILLMLALDMVLYLLIALYIEQIFPGEFGVPQRWYFPLTKSYWCGFFPYIGIEDVEYIINKDKYEQEPTDLTAGIQIRHLHKVFKKKIAVNKLSLNMYEGQITVLLGHNGAGKTTTMSMLTGMIPPTSGTAIIAGNDIRMNIAGVRDSLGLCPQHNILFDELTVREHLLFYGYLKGLDKIKVELEISKFLRLLDLRPKANSLSKDLSGGMKRKLSVGVALCGGSRVVMLDEPSSGMDPSARRALWDLLQTEKRGRTILLTTHFMDEADLLGDRIAIMADGILECCGSSFFLKKQYGAGYHLVIEKKINCNVDEITKLLKRYIPGVKVENDIGTELSYLLPENRVDSFKEMFAEFEEKIVQLGISSFGISLTTLEEVFMKVGSQEHIESDDDTEFVNKYKMMDNENKTNGRVENNLEKRMRHISFDFGDTNFLTGYKLFWNQFYAMLQKKVISTLRKLPIFIIQMVLPVFFLTIAILTTRSWKTDIDLPPLKIDIGTYDKTISVVNYYDVRTNFTDKIITKYNDIITNRSQEFINIGTRNFSEHILKQPIPIMRQRYIIGASFNGTDSITAWFNNEAYHSSALAMNMVYNSLLKVLFGDDHEIELYNKPLPFKLETKFKKLALQSSMGFQVAFNIGFSMAFVSSFYVLFYVRERISKAKHLQFVSGVKVLTFWSSAFLWDFTTFFVTSLFLVASLSAFQEDGFKEFNDIGRLFLILILFGYAMLPMMYLASFCFSIPSTGFTKMTLINVFTGLAAFLTVEILATPGLNLENVSKILDWVFLLIPHYALSGAIRSVNKIYSSEKICKAACEASMFPVRICRELICEESGQCCTDKLNYFSWKSPGIARHITFFLCIGTLLIFLLMVLEWKILESIIYKIKKQTIPSSLEEITDDDVQAEKNKINNLNENEIASYNIVLSDLTKYYKKNFLAVNKLSVGIKQGECFGLLGINGAGKTSTFKMMTGDEKISAGDGWINGMSLKSDIKNIYKTIGYCPQFDALIDEMTGRETMQMFCLLRGITRERSKHIATNLAILLDFIKHIDKQIGQYSGGNKRKLSTAIALIGNPSVIFLDEPTTGMDPATKRFFWNVVCRVRDTGRCIVLTSHSMEECEALCTRIAIMVNGTFRCLGSTQHLKNKFSAGYTLTIKIKKTTELLRGNFNDEGIQNIKEFIQKKFTNAVLREEHQELLTYYILDMEMPCSQMFGIMEQAKQSLNIEDYSLGQSNLEQVFLNFAKKQREAD